MTVKLLAQWGEFPAGSLFSSTAQTEAALVTAKVATTDLIGGVEYLGNTRAERFGVDSLGIPPRMMIPSGRAAAIGDSITAPGTGSWFHQLCLRSGGLVRRSINAGVAGNTTAQMVARIVTDVPKALRPDILFITGGTNDVSSAVSLSTITQNLAGMISYARSIGADPVLVKVPPRNTFSSQALALRDAYDALGERSGVVVLDPWAGFVSSQGVWVDGASSDGIHPTASTAFVASEVAWSQLSPYVRSGWDGLHAMTGIPGAIVTTDDFFVDTNADGTPNGFSGYALNGLVVSKSISAATVGNKFRMSTAGVDAGSVVVAGERVEERTISGLTLTAGDRLACSARVTLSGHTSGVRAHVRANMTGASALAIEPSIVYGDMTDAVVWAETTVPAGGATSVGLVIRLATTSTTAPSVGFLEVSQMQVWNLTQMGVVG